MTTSFMREFPRLEKQVFHEFNARLDDTYDTYFIICWKNVLLRVFNFWSKIKYVTYVIYVTKTSLIIQFIN